MRLYTGQVPTIASEMVNNLIKNQDIEVVPQEVTEVEEDVKSVLNEYIRMDRDLSNRARDTIESHGRDTKSFGRVKRQLAKQSGFGLGEDGIEYIVSQLIEMLMQSNHVEEIYADDPTIRKRVTPTLRRFMSTDEALDREVRRKIRNLKEGSMSWEVEYENVMNKLKKTKKLY